MVVCILPLASSSAYFTVYSFTVSFLLIKNKFRFSTQIKVTLFALFLSLSIQLASVVFMYLRSVGMSECNHDELSLTLFRLNESITMTIYIYIIMRMLYIYSQMFLAADSKPCRVRASTWVSKHQNFFIVLYFVVANACNWACWYLLVYQDPKFDLTGTEIDIFAAFSLLNFVVEMLLGFLFIMLCCYFHKASETFQQRISKGKRCLINFGVLIIVIFYFLSAIVFELFNDLQTKVERNHESGIVEVTEGIYFVRYALDFVSCMVILYLMNVFSPRQTLTAQQQHSSNQSSDPQQRNMSLSTEALQRDMFEQSTDRDRMQRIS